MTALPSFFNNKLPILKQIPIFQGINWFSLNRISRHVEIVDFNKGDIICQQGAPADSFYALVSGRVYSYSLGSLGHKEDVDFILRGMQFGVISTMTGENHSHTYEAINDSVLVKINKDSFSQLLKSTPQLAVALSQSLSQRIRSHVTHTKSTQESTIIAVYAPVKGSGSSTYATNLALSLKEQTDKKILLLSLSSDKNEERIDLANIVGDHHSILNTIIKGALTVDLLSVKFDPHSLKTRDQPNDQAKHSGLERGWQQIVEIGALETAIDELVERERLSQCLRNPAHYQAAKVGSERQQRQHQNASQDAGRR